MGFKGKFEWKHDEQKKLLELYKSEVDWPARSAKMYQAYPARQNKAVFSANACRAEFDRLMATPCPSQPPVVEGRAGYSIKAVVDMWVEHLRKEISKDLDRQMELSMVEIRNSYALVDRILTGNPPMSEEQMMAHLEEARAYDAESGKKDTELVVALYTQKLNEVFKDGMPKPICNDLPPTKNAEAAPCGFETAFRSPSPVPPCLSPLKSPIRSLALNVRDGLSPQAVRRIQIQQAELQKAATPVKPPPSVEQKMASPVKNPSPVKVSSPQKTQSPQKTPIKTPVKASPVKEKQEVKEEEAMDVDLPPAPVYDQAAEEEEEEKPKVEKAPASDSRKKAKGRGRGKTVGNPAAVSREETASPAVNSGKQRGRTVAKRKAAEMEKKGEKKEKVDRPITPALSIAVKSVKSSPGTPPVEEKITTRHAQTDISVFSCSNAQDKRERRQSTSRKLSRRSEADAPGVVSEDGTEREIGVQCMRMEFEREDKICVTWFDGEKVFVPTVVVKKEPLEAKEPRSVRSTPSMADDDDDRKSNKSESKREFTVIYNTEEWVANSLLKSPSYSLDDDSEKKATARKEERTREENIQMKSLLMNTWRAVHNHRHSGIFSHPVSERDAPGYNAVIKERMDLQTLKREIENGSVTTPSQLKHRLARMFANAVMFNSSGHDVNIYAQEMAFDTMAELNRLINEGAKSPVANYHPRRSKVAEEHSSRPSRSSFADPRASRSSSNAFTSTDLPPIQDSNSSKMFRHCVAAKRKIRR